MFPPVDDEVIKNNPKFAKLYKTLTTSILNSNSQLKESKEMEEIENIRQQADHRRLRAAKHHLLERAIATSSPTDRPSHASRTRVPDLSRDSLPTSERNLSESVVDLLLLLPPLLDAASSSSPSSPPNPELAALLLNSEPFLPLLSAAAPVLAALVATNLHASALALAQLVRPAADPALARQLIPSLESDYRALRDRHDAALVSLLRGRARTATALARPPLSLLPAHSDALAHLARCLEAKHGPAERSLELRAAEVALRAQQAQSDAAGTLVDLQREMDSADVGSALHTYAAHLRDAKVRAAERVRDLERELRGYGVDVGGNNSSSSAKEKMMLEMAKAHEEIGRQVAEVTQDLERLHTRKASCS